MQIKKGENRIVFIFPLVGIVIKFPLVYFRSTVKDLIDILKKYGDGRSIRLRKFWSFPVEGPSFKRFLFKGIVDNWREYKFYRRTKNIFLQPTYFSLLGFLNVQRAGQPCNIIPWYHLYDLIEEAIFKDEHCFYNPDNFCLVNGKLRILDYGSLKAQEVITEFGEKIFECFDPNYDWEEEKKKIQAKEKLT